MGEVAHGRGSQRAIRDIRRASDVRFEKIRAEVREMDDVNQARNAVAASAAQADAVLSALLNALPFQNESDREYRAYLQQNTRARTIADLSRFNP